MASAFPRSLELAPLDTHGFAHCFWDDLSVGGKKEEEKRREARKKEEWEGEREKE